MVFEFDPAKDDDNFGKHGLRLGDFEGFDADPAVVEDGRADYGEARFRAFGRIRDEGYCPAFTVRGPNLRLISFRRAHDKEMKRYE